MINNIEKKDCNILHNTNNLQANNSSQNVEVISHKGHLEDSGPTVIITDIKTHEFYNFPKYYDKAFTRDVRSDINFFEKCFQQYSDITVKKILEPACGPGMFLEILPQYGYYSLGYDLNPAMVNYSIERLNKCGLSINQANAIVGNMKNVEFDNEFDAAFICINSLGYLRNDEEIISHFKAMNKSIKKGGLYIVEISCKCDNLRNEKKFDDTWSIKEKDLELELTWAINWYDLERRIRHVDFQMVVVENGKKIVLEESHELRLWLFDEFKWFFESNGFKLVAIYDQNYNVVSENIPITGELGALFFVLKNVKEINNS
ncbi:MAG: class I SAM-dependent methyltransferase [Candidatus Hermodarchaeota archaeon]